MTRWNNLTPQQKAAEFDASHNNPTAYATDNFANTPTNTSRYETARTEQREQQQKRRNPK